MMNTAHFHHQRYSIGKSDIVTLPPFRGYPQRVYSATNEENPFSLYNKHCKKIVNYNYDYEKDIVIKGTLDEALEYWLVQHFTIADKIEVQELIAGLVSEVFLTKDGQRVSINNVGFGASQIVPVLYKVLISAQTQQCIVDEPEIHLHPSMQSKLADFFYTLARTGKKIFLETHSEYLIDKLVFLKLKHEDDNRTASMYWVKKNGPASEITEIEYDEMGFLVNPPNEFLTEKTKLVEMLADIRIERLQNEE